MEPRKVLIASFSPLPESVIEAFFAPFSSEVNAKIEIIRLYDAEEKKIFETLEKADIVIGDHTFKMKITRKMVEHMKKVKLIQQPSTGYDHIDVVACAEKGIPVANAGGANAVSVAEYTIMVALALLKRLFEANNRVQQGEWPQWELMDKGTFDLANKTWGIIGLGRIGKELAKRLVNFEVKVIYYDKVRQEDFEKKYNIEYRSLSRLLRESDIVSIHLPLTDETRKMITEKELRSMKPSAILINPSRGEIVDEEALARALSEKWIWGAAVDVYSQEPPSKDNPLLKLKDVNLITTPHIAGANTDARLRIIEFSIRNIIRVIKGEKPEGVVNMQL
jgi:phosphoglycerate dehydrogenase-like enzyme